MNLIKMFNFVNKYYVGLLVIIVFIIVFICTNEYIKSLHNKIDVLTSNNYALTTSVNEITTKYDNVVVTTQALIVGKKELAETNDSLYKRLKELNIRFRDTDAAAKLYAKEIKKLKLAIRDSLVYVNIKDTIRVDTLKCFDYADKYTKVDGCIQSDSVSINYSAEVPIDIIIENVYKHKFLWFKWKPISKKVYVTSDNKAIKFTNIKLYIPK